MGSRVRGRCLQKTRFHRPSDRFLRDWGHPCWYQRAQPLVRLRADVLTRLGRSPTTTRSVNPWDSRTFHSLSVFDPPLNVALRFTFEIEHPRCQGSKYAQKVTDIPQTKRMITDEEVTFVHPDDLDLYNAWDSRAFEVQVANHELLGHGSGKLFQEGADGKKNFDPEKVINPLTHQPM